MSARRNRLIVTSLLLGASLLMGGVVFLGFAPGCVGHVVALASRSRVDWDFVQSVGGLKVLEPERQPDGSWLLPVACDVSGLTAVTVEPTAINSGIEVASTEAVVDSGTIQLWIVTCVAGDEDLTCKAPPARLAELAPGDHQVVYRNPDGSSVPLRTIRIGD
jgi:hypothetical protein